MELVEEEGLDGGADRQRGRGNSEGKCGTSHCNQWGLCGIVIFCHEGGNMAFPKLLWDFLLLIYYDVMT